MSKTKRELATEIYKALHGQQYFIQTQGLVGCEIEEFRKNVISDIEAELPDCPETDVDPYILGLHESEVRKILSHDHAYFKDKKKLDAVIEALGEFNYCSLWDDVNDFAEFFINDDKTKDD